MSRPGTAGAGRPDQDLTILLTLRDRVAYTLRWMEYANSVAFPFRVMVADGGSDDAALALLADKARFPNVDYDYVRYPPDTSYSAYYAKVVDALGQVRTPFVAMADNDDFFIVEGLRQSVRFLAGHDDYVSCGGQGAIFWVGTAGKRDTGGQLFGDELQWKCTREVRSIDAASASERLQVFSVSKSDPCYYDVRRIGVARQQMELVRDLDLKDLFLVEQLVWYLCAIAGRSKRLERLYVARQQNSPDSSGGQHESVHGDWFGRMLAPSWSEDFARFVGAVSAALAEADGIPLDVSAQRVIGSYRASVAPALLSDLMDEPTVTAWMPSLLGAVRRLVRLPERHFLRRLSRALYRRLAWVSLDIVYGRKVLAIPVPDAERDLAPVRAFLARSR